MSINFFRAFRHFDSFILVEIHAHNLCAVNAFLFAWKRTIVTTTAINDIDWYHPNEMDVKWHKQWEYYDRTQISLVVIHDSWTIFEYIMTPFCTIPADIVGVFSNINSMPCTLWTISFTHSHIVEYWIISVNISSENITWTLMANWFKIERFKGKRRGRSRQR